MSSPNTLPVSPAAPADTAVSETAATPQGCHHMTKMVGALAADTLTGPARWYTQFHMATCPKCRAAFIELKARTVDAEHNAAQPGVSAPAEPSARS